MLWFGYKIFADICNDGARVATPVGESCFWCDEAIGPDENGFLVKTVDLATGTTNVPIHAECNFRRLVGGVYHQQRRCACFGGDLGSDPEDLSIREAAVLAVQFYNHSLGLS